MEIVSLTKSDLKSLVQLYRDVSAALRREGIHQWDRFYPNRFVIGSDVKRGTAFGLHEGGRVIGAVVVDGRQSGKYKGLPWKDQSGDSACIHRLAVHPEWQGKGIGRTLLQYAELEARCKGCTSIRLDVFTGNPGAVGMYQRAGYAEVGAIRFPMRHEPYLCFEKPL
ncbi:GNAT family N-acetyltransferase [Paenibacillus sp. MMO-58]|uniref:GNAT family N-acetyltransferase n=1 Tax=Paenibacillus sp. MMO-58 TaxID=3081290 RepID=UPI003015C99C